MHSQLRNNNCPDGGIGRRAGLKHQWGNPSRFDPGSGYAETLVELLYEGFSFCQNRKFGHFGGSSAKSGGAVYQCIKFTTILTSLKLLPLALCVNKFTHINIVDFFITRSITSNKFALSSLNQEIRLLAIFNGTSVENYYSTCLFIAKGNSPPRAEGQRWEAQRVAEQ